MYVCLQWKVWLFIFYISEVTWKTICNETLRSCYYQKWFSNYNDGKNDAVPT